MNAEIPIKRIKVLTSLTPGVDTEITVVFEDGYVEQKYRITKQQEVTSAMSLYPFMMTVYEPIINHAKIAYAQIVKSRIEKLKLPKIKIPFFNKEWLFEHKPSPAIAAPGDIVMKEWKCGGAPCDVFGMSASGDPLADVNTDDLPKSDVTNFSVDDAELIFEKAVSVLHEFGSAQKPTSGHVDIDGARIRILIDPYMKRG